MNKFIVDISGEQVEIEISVNEYASIKELEKDE